MTTLRLFAASFLACGLSIVTTSGQATVNRVGGNGGVRYDVACGPGEVLVGLAMQATPARVPLVQWIESAYPICAKVKGSAWDGGPIHYVRSSVGAWAVANARPSPPRENIRICEPGSAVTGFQGYAGSYVDRLQLACRSLASVDRTAGSVTILPVFPSTSSGAITVPVATCEGLRFEMRQGETIDQLLLRMKDEIAGVASCLLPTNWTIRPTTVTPPAVVPREAGGPSPFTLRECSGGRPATGLYGRAGATVLPTGGAAGPMYVDSIGLKCVDEHEWRPRYHFSPAKGWMNDPAGLVAVNGRYHLFFQSVPDPLPLSTLAFRTDKVVWGHASSASLFDWTTETDPALTPTSGPLVKSPFTGSAVVLNNNERPCPNDCRGTCVAAVFTRHLNPGGPQGQAVATSCSTDPDFMRRFGNETNLEAPVVAGGPHFRDPKLVWFDDPSHASGGFWVMVIAAGPEIKFYSSCSASGACSGNVTEWTPLTQGYSHTMFPALAVTGPFFETPDLFPLQVEGSNERLWVLTFAKGYFPPFAPGGHDRYSESWYQVGSFDGRKFTPKGVARRLDAGPDLYAAQTWFTGRASTPQMTTVRSPMVPRTPPGRPSAAALPQKRTIMAGWQNNWRYAHLLPTSGWKGQLSVPRELTLRQFGDDDYRVIQKPVAELAQKRLTNRPASWQVRDLALTSGTGTYAIPGFREKQYDVDLKLQLAANAKEVQVKIRDGAAPGRLVVGWRRTNGPDGELYIDRRNGYTGGDTLPVFTGIFTTPEEHPVRLADGKTLELRIVVDRSSVEVFAAGGEVAMSGLFFPDPANTGFEVSVVPDLRAVSRSVDRRAAAPPVTVDVSRILSLDVFSIACDVKFDCRPEPN